jgi:hypothetical protein
MTTPANLRPPDLTLASADTGELTTMVTGADVSAGISPVWIALPDSGQLLVVYEFQDQPAATAMLWHQGGTYEDLVPGPQTYNSLPGDAIYVALAYEGQSIKVGWAYT